MLNSTNIKGAITSKDIAGDIEELKRKQINAAITYDKFAKDDVNYKNVDGMKPSDFKNHNDATGSFSVVVVKGDPSITGLSGKEGLKYLGVNQELITSGNTNGGTLQYKLGDGEYSTTHPGRPCRRPTAPPRYIGYSGAAGS